MKKLLPLVFLLGSPAFAAFHGAIIKVGLTPGFYAGLSVTTLYGLWRFILLPL